MFPKKQGREPEIVFLILLLAIYLSFRIPQSYDSVGQPAEHILQAMIKYFRISQSHDSIGVLSGQVLRGSWEKCDVRFLQEVFSLGDDATIEVAISDGIAAAIHRVVLHLHFPGLKAQVLKNFQPFTDWGTISNRPSSHLYQDLETFNWKIPQTAALEGKMIELTVEVGSTRAYQTGLKHYNTKVFEGRIPLRIRILTNSEAITARKAIRSADVRQLAFFIGVWGVTFFMIALLVRRHIGCQPITTSPCFGGLFSTEQLMRVFAGIAAAMLGCITVLLVRMGVNAIWGEGGVSNLFNDYWPFLFFLSIGIGMSYYSWTTRF